MRRGPAPINPMVLALSAIGIFFVIVFFAFTKSVPFVDGYRIDAMFESSNQLRKGSPVRIAGVTVGKVAGFKDGPGVTRIVTLELEEGARPLHADATLKIRPRVFLEGGYYVQIRPGTPQRRELRDGEVIPLAQTAVPVQINDLLAAFRRPTRDSFKRTLAELNRSLAGGGAEALVRTNRHLGPALRDMAQIAEALRGQEPLDLSQAIRASSRLTAALASRDAQLADLVTDLNTTTGALADESDALRQSIRLLDGVLQDAPPQLELIDRALPSVTRLTSALRPSLRLAPGVLRPLASLLDQVRAAAGPAELPRLLTLTRPVVRRLPRLERRLGALFRQVPHVTDCVRDRVAPVLEATLEDGTLSTGQPVWQEALHAMVGVASSGSSFDANGAWLRLIGLVGERTLSVGSTLPGPENLLGSVAQPILGTRPQPLPPGQIPPLRPDRECRDQPAPNLRAATGPAPPQTAAAARPRLTPQARAKGLKLLRDLLKARR